MIEQMTSRQMEVLRLVCAGLCNKQIAARLGISIKTTEHHRQHVNEKLKVNSAVAMARVAIKSGLISVEEFLDSQESENILHGYEVATQAPKFSGSFF